MAINSTYISSLVVLVLYLLVLVLVLPGFKIKVHYPDHISQNKISNKIQFDRCDLAYELQLVFYELLIEPFFYEKTTAIQPYSVGAGEYLEL